MKPKPDAKVIRRAEAQLQARHEPRGLWRAGGFIESGISVDDQERVVALAHRKNGQAMRAELAKSLATIRSEFEFFKSHIDRIAPGNHRNWFRMFERVLNAFERLTHQ